jgi:type II secretory pathway pseudopilin PulG
MKERLDDMDMTAEGQGAKPPGCRGLDDQGFILVALLVGMAVAAVWLGAALPAWRQQAMREKETELIFRGEQYARAIVLYQKKNEGRFPPSFDTLVSDRYLRKKYVDPVTGKEFFPVGIGQPATAPGGPGQTPAQQGRGAPIAPAGQTGQPQSSASAPGIIGVRSTSNATSIKIYRGQQQHALWPFDAAQLYGKMGYSPAANRGGGPGRAGPGRGRDGRGAPVRPGAGGPGRGRDGGPATPGRRGGGGPGGPGRGGRGG